MAETITTYIWNARVGSKVVLLQGVFYWNERFEIASGTMGTVVKLEPQRNNPNAVITVNLHLPDRMLPLVFRDPFRLLGLVTPG